MCLQTLYRSTDKVPKLDRFTGVGRFEYTFRRPVIYRADQLGAWHRMVMLSLCYDIYWPNVDTRPMITAILGSWYVLQAFHSF